MMTLLPQHGPLDCGRCFPPGAAWGEAYRPATGWQLERNPCAWGSLNPRVLVLGFSKGMNQTIALDTRAYDAVPFKGMRRNLSTILQTLGVLAPGEQVDDRIRADENDLAFASLIRCAVSKLDAATGRYVKSGDIIGALARSECGGNFVSNCAMQFLSVFPPRLRLVVMLSNDDAYIAACAAVLQSLHQNLRRINTVAYAVDQARFVHVAHPSGSSGRHINDWLTGTTGKQAAKRVMAMKAVSA